MSRPIDKKNVEDLFRGVPEATVREMCIEALRRWRRREPTSNAIQMHGALGCEVVPQLLAYRNQSRTADEQNQLKEPFIDAQDEAWMTPIVEFIRWFVGAGFATPTASWIATWWTCGSLVVARPFGDAPADHPMLPNYLARVAARCPNLPASILELLTDAGACLDHGLRRPGIVLMGVAYEVAIEAVVDSLVTRNVAAYCRGAEGCTPHLRNPRRDRYGAARNNSARPASSSSCSPDVSVIDEHVFR